MVALAVTPGSNSDNPGHAVTHSTQKVTKVSEEVALAITEAFHELAEDDVKRDRAALLQWFRDRQASEPQN